MSLITLTIDQLVKSARNVRSNKEDCENVGALAASIQERGLFLPLIVRKAAGGSQWEVLDGGRRRLAIERSIAAGAMPADWPIVCVECDVSDAEATEISLGAWLLGVALHPYEVDAAVVNMHRDGLAVDVIARDLGQREVWVRRRLRLGGLAPDIFDAYAHGAIGADLAEAYAATEDQTLQHTTWLSFAGAPAYSHTPRAVRARMGVNDATRERSLRFVGAETYRAAGGRFELDLFADGPPELTRWRGRVVDPGLLATLHEERMAMVRAEVRAAVARPDLQFLAEPPRARHGGVAYDLEWRDGLPEANDPGSLAAMVESGIAVPPDLTVLAAVIEDGGVELTWYWPSAKARGAAEAAAAVTTAATAAATRATQPNLPVTVDYSESAGFDKYSGDAQAARANAKAEFGVTEDGLQVMRGVEHALLRAALVDDAMRGGDVARDWVIWAMLRSELGHDRASATGLRGPAGAWSGDDATGGEIAGPFLAGSVASQLWDEVVAALRADPSMAEKAPDAGLAAWLDAPAELHRVGAAVLVGLLLVRSAHVAGWRVPAHDRIAREIGATDTVLRMFWAPDAKFIGLLPKLKRLELVEPLIGTARTTRLAKLKDGPQAEAVAALLAKDPAWLHPILSFGIPEVGIPEPAGMEAAGRTSAQAADKGAQATSPDFTEPAGMEAAGRTSAQATSKKRRMAREAEPAA